jgi:hypothetical protein
MTKKWLFFVMSLFLMMAVKQAFAQDASTIGWDLDDDPTHDVVAVAMIAAPILGVIFGALRLLSTDAFRPVTTLNLGADISNSQNWRRNRLR